VSTESINEKLVRNAPKSTEKLLELLFDGLDWPRPADMEIEDIPLLDWSPDELHLDPTAVARLEKIAADVAVAGSAERAADAVLAIATGTNGQVALPEKQNRRWSVVPAEHAA